MNYDLRREDLLRQASPPASCVSPDEPHFEKSLKNYYLHMILSTFALSEAYHLISVAKESKVITMVCFIIIQKTRLRYHSSHA